MAKKSHIKVRMVPEAKPDSAFIYYAKKPTKGEKAKNKLKLKKYNPNTRKHEVFVEKNYLLTASKLKFLPFIFNVSINHRNPNLLVISISTFIFLIVILFFKNLFNSFYQLCLFYVFLIFITMSTSLVLFFINFKSLLSILSSFFLISFN